MRCVYKKLRREKKKFVPVFLLDFMLLKFAGTVLDECIVNVEKALKFRVSGTHWGFQNVIGRTTVAARA